MAYDRLRQRGRKEESGVPMQFIEVISTSLNLSLVKALNCFVQGLHQSYEDWLIHQSQVTSLLSFVFDKMNIEDTFTSG